ncbi:hypothetical protein M514_15296 [Trichuris suis]|uniref:Uncharacterized protein n=1 Tax=Trichuris suis TaxID=68888 RepID=A0A085NSL4_9BILA|nr:hypothetical protein M514_15296 [Trichuris suis]
MNEAFRRSAEWKDMTPQETDGRLPNFRTVNLMMKTVPEVMSQIISVRFGSANSTIGRYEKKIFRFGRKRWSLSGGGRMTL